MLANIRRFPNPFNSMCSIRIIKKKERKSTQAQGPKGHVRSAAYFSSSSFLFALFSSICTMCIHGGSKLSRERREATRGEARSMEGHAPQRWPRLCWSPWEHDSNIFEACRLLHTSMYSLNMRAGSMWSSCKKKDTAPQTVFLQTVHCRIYSQCKRGSGACDCWSIILRLRIFDYWGHGICATASKDVFMKCLFLPHFLILFFIGSLEGNVLFYFCPF